MSPIFYYKSVVIGLWSYLCEITYAQLLFPSQSLNNNTHEIDVVLNTCICLSEM